MLGGCWLEMGLGMRAGRGGTNSDSTSSLFMLATSCASVVIS